MIGNHKLQLTCDAQRGVLDTKIMHNLLLQLVGIWKQNNADVQLHTITGILTLQHEQFYLLGYLLGVFRYQYQNPNGEY